MSIVSGKVLRFSFRALAWRRGTADAILNERTQFGGQEGNRRWTPMHADELASLIWGGQAEGPILNERTQFGGQPGSAPGAECRF
jgi:hypothetical protein